MSGTNGQIERLQSNNEPHARITCTAVITGYGSIPRRRRLGSRESEQIVQGGPPRPNKKSETSRPGNKKKKKKKPSNGFSNPKSGAAGPLAFSRSEPLNSCVLLPYHAYLPPSLPSYLAVLVAYSLLCIVRY